MDVCFEGFFPVTSTTLTATPTTVWDETNPVAAKFETILSSHALTSYDDIVHTRHRIIIPSNNFRRYVVYRRKGFCVSCERLKNSAYVLRHRVPDDYLFNNRSGLFSQYRLVQTWYKSDVVECKMQYSNKFCRKYVFGRHWLMKNCSEF